MRGNLSSGRYVKWSYTTGDWVWSSPAIGDINGDGQIEVVVGDWDGTVYALRGTDGTLLWSYTTGGYVTSSPAIGDINGDGQIEVVVGSWDGNVYALRGTNGSLIWSYTTGNAVYSSPAIGDINGDGQIEVVVGSYYGGVYALRGTDETLLWYYTTGGGVWSSPAIGDIDGDGQIEVVVGSYYGGVYALRGTDGTILWSYNIGYYHWFEDVVLADIDPTPGIEVITHGSLTPTYVLSSSGTLLWSMSAVMGQRSLSVGDVDGDGCVEIVSVGDGATMVMVAVIDASSNEGGCGADVEEVDKALNPDGYVEVYGVDGKLVYRGKYKEFKGGSGVYFVKEGRKAKKMVLR